VAKELADPYRPLQRRFWMVERVGWVVLTLIILWAAAGGAGGGPLSQTRLQGAGVELGYDEFTRRGARTPIELRWPAASDRELTVSLDGAFVDRMKLDFYLHGLSPVRSGQTVTLSLGRPTEPGRLVFNAHPVEFGTSSSEIRIGGQPIGRISVFVFP
jgi:hypothetical protein